MSDAIVGRDRTPLLLVSAFVDLRDRRYGEMEPEASELLAPI